MYHRYNRQSIILSCLKVVCSWEGHCRKSAAGIVIILARVWVFTVGHRLFVSSVEEGGRAARAECGPCNGSPLAQRQNQHDRLQAARGGRHLAAAPPSENQSMFGCGVGSSRCLMAACVLLPAGDVAPLRKRKSLALRVYIQLLGVFANV